MGAVPTTTKGTTMSKIVVIGGGFVGLNTAKVLARKNEVVVLEISEAARRNAMKEGLVATLDRSVLLSAEWIFICVPTNSGAGGHLSIDKVIGCLSECPVEAKIVIRSTLPLGDWGDILKSVTVMPEFLREATAWVDASAPSRIVAGGGHARLAANLMLDCVDGFPELIIVGVNEAIAIKLFTNTYLAMRVAFFNEVDTYCQRTELNVTTIIDGMGADYRVGRYYNAPSEGFGGHCLPKDSLSVAAVVDLPLMWGIQESNMVRKSKS